ncbi:CD3072 family TudS-related putative desulfidase [Pelotomaculum terephthalicicum]|uniref:CD3072 family TudS-related putative desulfidase n=1 Tax=Pelotomaculum terephthalicicum TaxID=206393 RepID=UPI0035E3E758
MLLSHCILNANSKVEGLSGYAAIISEIVSMLMEKEIAIIQLPCPEMTVYGIKRWGHVREQFDTPFFREKCREIIKPIIYQLIDYVKNGYKIIGIIGIDGSPSCGVSKTCSGDWGGELSANINDAKEKLSTAAFINKSGIFIEEITKLLNSNHLSMPIAAIDEIDVVSSINNIKQLFVKILMNDMKSGRG